MKELNYRWLTKKLSRFAPGYPIMFVSKDIKKTCLKIKMVMKTWNQNQIVPAILPTPTTITQKNEVLHLGV